MDNGTKQGWISSEGAAAFILRLALGALFFMAGLGKFLAPGGALAVSQKLMDGFADTYLPASLTWAFLRTLPYVEISLGAILVIGLFTRECLIICGLLLLSLAFGMMVKGEHAVVAQNLNYVFMAAIALWLSGRDNRYSLDCLIWRPKK